MKHFIPWLIKVLFMSSNSSSSICVCALHGNYLLIFMKLAMESSSSEVEGAAHSASGRPVGSLNYLELVPDQFGALTYKPLIFPGFCPIRCVTDTLY